MRVSFGTRTGRVSEGLNSSLTRRVVAESADFPDRGYVYRATFRLSHHPKSIVIPELQRNPKTVVNCAEDEDGDEPSPPNQVQLFVSP